MNDRDFIYWLQGFFEISFGNYVIDRGQIQMIKDHLNLARKNITYLDEFSTAVEFIAGLLEAPNPGMDTFSKIEKRIQYILVKETPDIRNASYEEIVPAKLFVSC